LSFIRQYKVKNTLILTRYLLFVNLCCRAGIPRFCDRIGPALRERRTGFDPVYLASDRTTDVDLCTRHSKATPLLVKVERTNERSEHSNASRASRLFRHRSPARTFTKERIHATRLAPELLNPTGLPKRLRRALIVRIANEASFVRAFDRPRALLLN